MAFVREPQQVFSVLFFGRPRSEGWPHHGRTSPFISVLCHSDWLFHVESCPCLDVVYPGRCFSMVLSVLLNSIIGPHWLHACTEAAPKYICHLLHAVQLIWKSWKAWKTHRILLTRETLGKLLEFYFCLGIFGIIFRFMLVLTRECCSA